MTLYYLAILLYHGALSAWYPYDLNYAEGYVLNDAVRLARGQTVWSDISQFPMVRSPYPPLYLALVGALSTMHPSFVAGRLVSLLATLTVGALLFDFGRRHGLVAGIATAGLWLGSTFVYQWAPLARVDLLGVALSLAAILLLTEHVTSRRLVAAAILCALALLTKQTLLAAPLSIALFLLLRRDWRCLWFLGVVVVLVGTVTLAFSIVSDGQYAQHVLFGNATNPFRLERVAELGGPFLGLNAIALAVGLWALGQEWMARRLTVPLVYAPIALGTVVSIGNVSGDINYFLEPTAALALLVPFAVSRLSPTAFTGLMIAQLVILAHIPNGFMSQYPPGPAKGATPRPEDVQIGDHVLATIREAGPESLVEPAGFAVLAGVPVWIQPIDLIAEQRNGRWTPDLLVRSLETHRWAVVVLNYKFLPGEVLDALERSYEQTEGLASPNGFSYFIYRPGPLIRPNEPMAVVR